MVQNIKANQVDELWSRQDVGLTEISSLLVIQKVNIYLYMSEMMVALSKHLYFTKVKYNWGRDA